MAVFALGLKWQLDIHWNPACRSAGPAAFGATAERRQLRESDKSWMASRRRHGESLQDLNSLRVHDETKLCLEIITIPVDIGVSKSRPPPASGHKQPLTRSDDATFRLLMDFDVD
jgi:hypothetical protein